MIIVNTGNGKGKTTSAVGQIVRSLGQGFKVCLIQLFKSKKFYGEQKILIELDNLDFFPFAKKHPYCAKNISLNKTINQCYLAMKKIEEISNNLTRIYDLVVLDEFNIALRDDFISKNKFIALMKQLSKKTNVIITGREANQELIDIADLVTEMREIKHPYSKGKRAQKGIEY
jgi:cob(I)alamin adenosyltransferase